MLFCTTKNLYNVVYFEKADLNTLGIDPLHISSDDTKKLLKSVVGPAVSNIKTEIFPGCEGIIMFFKRSSSEFLFFEFESFEDLISAVSKSSPLPSKLFFMEGKYILSVLPWEEEDIPSSFYEYGEITGASSDMIPFFSEHGKVLIENGAVQKLLSYFQK